MPTPNRAFILIATIAQPPLSLAQVDLTSGLVTVLAPFPDRTLRNVVSSVLDADSLTLYTLHSAGNMTYARSHGCIHLFTALFCCRYTMCVHNLTAGSVACPFRMPPYTQLIAFDPVSKRLYGENGVSITSVDPKTGPDTCCFVLRSCGECWH